jgi:Ca2+-binding RTX toxin-like protein
VLGDARDNRITGFGTADIFMLQQGGNDEADGLGGNDGFYFGNAFDRGDHVDGGDGTDTLALQGNTATSLDDVSNVEVILALSGSDTRFGDTAGNRYDYDLTTNDGNVGAGKTLTVQATGLLPGEDLHFDGSAESDGNFRIFAGQGTDVLKGGAGSDGFFFGADGNFTGADHVEGGAGSDTLALRGNYVGPNAVLFQNGSFSGIEVLALLSGHSNEYSGQVVPTGFDYDVTMANGNVAAGALLDVNAARLGADESVRFDGRAELDGSFRILSGAGDDTLFGSSGNDLIYGGLGKDALDGGAGADTFLYRSAAESTSTGYDTITGFDWHVDRIDAPGGARAVSQAGSGALSTASFDADLAAGLSGVLGAGQAALFTASSGSLAGHVFAVIDTNGVAGYQAGEDLVIELVAPVPPIDPMAGVIVEGQPPSRRARPSRSGRKASPGSRIAPSDSRFGTPSPAGPSRQGGLAGLGWDAGSSLKHWFKTRRCLGKSCARNPAVTAKRLY